jgi:hypothetical protein
MANPKLTHGISGLVVLQLHMVACYFFVVVAVFMSLSAPQVFEAVAGLQEKPASNCARRRLLATFVPLTGPPNKVRFAVPLREIRPSSIRQEGGVNGGRAAGI